MCVYHSFTYFQLWGLYKCELHCKSYSQITVVYWHYSKLSWKFLKMHCQSSGVNWQSFRLTRVLLKLTIAIFRRTKPNKFVCSLFFAYSRDNVIPNLNLSLENIYKLKMALFTHKINVTSIPMIFKGTLTLASEVHNYNTRFVSKLIFTGQG